VRVLVLGGIRSGKSEWAESAIAGAVGEDDPVRYLATGPAAEDDAWATRLSAHRARRPHHWSTVETSDVAKQLRADDTRATMVDDIGGWLTAAMDRTHAWAGGSTGAEIDDLVDAVAQYRAELVLVSPEVGLTVMPATSAGRRFADELGALNQRLARVCDFVVLIVAGQPLPVKEPS
jgi:adenosylcobinamide kinase/adenosylcobinamide-phosphate guanylyltransferase